jgi:DUF4097 and DUF4098 domain-containing protein YvlB
MARWFMTRALASFGASVLLLPSAAAAQPFASRLPPTAPRLHPTLDQTGRAWLARYEEERSGPEQSEQWSRSFKVGPDGSIDLSNLSGDVKVTGGAGSEIRIDATKRVRAKAADAARRQLSGLSIEATEHAGRVDVRTYYPRGSNIEAEIDFVVHVPDAAGVTIHTVSGDIAVEKVKGEVRLESVSGGLTAVDTPQLSRAKTVSGDLSISGALAADALTLGTVSGDLVATRVKTRSIDLQTVSGDLRLEEVSCERAQVRSVSGDVTFSGPLAKSGRYEFVSHSGDVRVSVGASSGFELTANTFSGDIRSELKLTGMSGGRDEHESEIPGLPKNREVRGTYGDGSAVLIVKTFSGSVVVTR